MSARSRVLLACVGSLAGAPAEAQALRFFGTGTGQQDRVRIRVDDDVAGAGSAPCDVGAGSFSLTFWLRGALAANATMASSPGSHADNRWIDGNIVLDRDIWGGSDRDFGVSVAGGRVRFGTGGGDGGIDGENTLEGASNVLDGAWHHVACVRDTATGTKRIFVDGVLDAESPPGVSTVDISYPDAGVPGQVTPWGPFLVIGAEKHDAGPQYPSFTGWIDEVSVWDVALSPADVAATWPWVVLTGTPGLVGHWAFGEGGGPRAFDSSGAGAPICEVIAGLPGNAEWVTGPGNEAPVMSGLTTYFCAGNGIGGATPCPCGNNSVHGGLRGCLSSLGVGGALRGSGLASLANDTVALFGLSLTDSSVLFFQGTTMQSGGAGSVFGDGLRCAGGSVVRLGTKTAQAGSARYPGPGDASVSARGLVSAPGGRSYQAWYRNAATFCTSATFNLTNGLWVGWSP